MIRRRLSWAPIAGLWIPLLASLPACTSTPTPPAVLQDGLEDGTSLWQRVETEHFVVESNESSDRRVRRVASEFETLWHAFASVPILGMRPPSRKPLVVVLRDAAEYRYLHGDQSAGVFIENTALGPLIVLPPNSGAFRATVVKHELAHFVCSDFLPPAPLWLHEGLAQVMETAEYDTNQGEVLFGAHSPGLAYSASFPLPADRFTSPWPAGLSSTELRKYYGRSWLLVHFLVDYHLQPFLDFLVRVGSGEDWQAAWDEEFLLLSQGLDETLDRYHRRAEYGLWKVRARLPDMDAFEPTALAASDALALRAALLAYSTNPTRSRAESLQSAARDLEAALARDPASERARVLLEALQPSGAN